MSDPTWNSDGGYPELRPISALGWLRVAIRALLIGVIVFGGCCILLLLRLIERPIFGDHRPWTPHITQFACRMAIRIMGLDYKVTGTPMREAGAVVANHSSWLDIFTLNASDRIYFVSKAEVSKWPGIGWLAKSTGTVFIARDRKEAGAQKALFERRSGAGHKLLFFPEGTSTDSLRVLPFKSTLFAAFFADALRDKTWIQPVTVNYLAPDGADARTYGWWGDMDFGGHLLQTLAAAKQGSVELVYHEPVKVSDFSNRKVLTQTLETKVREGHHIQGKIA